MKILFTLICVLIFLNLSKAQEYLLPNGDFEDWVFTGSYYEPYNWNSLNVYSEAGCPIWVKPDSPGYKGKYAIGITTKICDIPSIPFYDTIAGYVFLGERDQGPGVYYPARPNYFKFAYKYESGSGKDTASVLFLLYKHLPGQAIKNIGFGGFDVFTNQPTYKIATVPIYYQFTEMPDSMTVYLASSKGVFRDMKGVYPGNKLVIDNILVDKKASINNALTTFGNAYPNPVSNLNELRFPMYLNGASVSIFDVSGKTTLGSYTIQSKVLNVNETQLKPGIYFLRISKNGRIFNQRLVLTP